MLKSSTFNIFWNSLNIFLKHILYNVYMVPVTLCIVGVSDGDCLLMWTFYTLLHNICVCVKILWRNKCLKLLHSLFLKHNKHSNFSCEIYYLGRIIITLSVMTNVCNYCKSASSLLPEDKSLYKLLHKVFTQCTLPFSGLLLFY